MKSNTRLREFTQSLAKQLDLYSFKQVGQDKLVLLKNDLLYLIKLSDSGKVKKYFGEHKVTCEIGIISIPLARLLDGNKDFCLYPKFNINNPKIGNSHWSKSTLFICNVKEEVWLPYNTGTEFERSVLEMADILINHGIPDLMKYSTTNDLVCLWEAGGGPGLSPLQAKRYCALYKESTK